MSKPFLKVLFSVAGVALLFLNVNVVLSAKASAGGTIMASLYSAAVADTSGNSTSHSSTSGSSTSSSSSSSSSSSHSSTSGSSTSGSSSSGSSSSGSVPSSWGSSNPWNTGQYYYQTTRSITSGTTMTEESSDGGHSWSITGTILGAGITATAPIQKGSKLVRTITFSTTVTLQCCSPGGTSRCDYPAC